ncbi:DUF6636 domain-containing protein [Brachybacterium sp. J144]|uniref:DUF6636 domain-containing protein n=1 Tax=Brachybacterium sp. J144 TaxID=3116487 RepID=UPI002E79E7F5|nr:DUF6636 domain-containing protein [Brachybacterium sp. J144]MEE1651572.1 DUF6636 domain-containing protein [Brachybacterium sp. J144]
MAEPRTTAEEAADPATSPERLLELAQHHPELQVPLVLNPATPQVAKDWILATSPEARQALEQAEGARGKEGEEGTVGAEPSDDPDATRRHPIVTDSPAFESGPETSAWGDLASAPDSTPSAADPEATAAWTPVPQEVPAPAAATTAAAGPTGTVRIAPSSGVVPLPSTPDREAPGPVAAPGPAYGAPTAALPAAPAPQADDGEGRRDRRMWFACGGCLLLALVLLVVGGLVGRAWLSGDEEGYERDSSTTAAEEPAEGSSPAEESASPTEDPVSPAPEDALEMSAVQSPTGNIRCELDGDTVACSLEETRYDEDVEDCGDSQFTIRATGEEVALDCEGTVGAEGAETLEYGQTAVDGNVACTSRDDGMTCWDVRSGHGFMVSRGTYETF